MWYTTFPKGWTSTFESVPEHILRRGHIFNSWLRWFCSRYMAITTLYGYHDLCGTDCITNSGECFFLHFIRYHFTHTHTHTYPFFIDGRNGSFLIDIIYGCIDCVIAIIEYVSHMHSQWTHLRSSHMTSLRWRNIQLLQPMSWQVAIKRNARMVSFLNIHTIHESVGFGLNRSNESKWTNNVWGSLCSNHMRTSLFGQINTLKCH